MIWPQETPKAKRSRTDPRRNVLESSIPSHMQILLYTYIHTFFFCQVMQVNLLAIKIKTTENDLNTKKNISINVIIAIKLKINNDCT